MTDIELLPMPSVLLNWPHPTNHVAIRDYARAVAEHNVKERDAEIERLRAITDNREAIIATHAADTREYQKHLMHAEARAERLAEVGQAMRDNLRCVLRVNCNCDDEFIDRQTAEWDAALHHTAAQENDDA